MILAPLAAAALVAVSSAKPPARKPGPQSGPLDYPGGRYEVLIGPPASRGGYTEREVRFPSPIKSAFAANDTVWGHYLVPDEAPASGAPTILVLPVMAAPNVWIETRFIKRFLKDGFIVLWLEMPYQFHRRPHPSQPSGQVFLARTPKRLAANFRQSALDARRALEWLKGRPEVDAGRVGLFGISLGALVSASVYSVDSTPKFAAFMLGGADFSSLLAASSMTGPFVKKMGMSPELMAPAWAGLDPLEYKEKNRDKKAVLINASWDAVIPKANALKLKEAFPSSRHRWVPLGHYSAILHLFWIPRSVSREFQENL